MITKYAKEEDIPALRRLWKQAFGDTDQLLDGFFSVAFSPDRCLCGWEDGQLVAMVYWFDHHWKDRLIAYGYAVATDENYRKRGFCHKLLESLRRRLHDRGYYGILLVPEDGELMRFYEKMGYVPCCGMEHYDLPGAGELDPGIRKITWEQYAWYRPQLLPEGSVTPGEEVYRYLSTYLDFYRADAGIFCATVVDTPEGKRLQVQEFLGEPKGLFTIIKAMGCVSGEVRLKGAYPYGVFRRLTREKELPNYFGLPMD